MTTPATVNSVKTLVVKSMKILGIQSQQDPVAAAATASRLVPPVHSNSSNSKDFMFLAVDPSRIHRHHTNWRPSIWVRSWLCAISVSVVYLIAMMPLFGQLQAQTFTASGVCYYTNFTASGAVGRVINGSFIASQEDQRVYIRFNFAPDHYEEWAYDGTNDYLLIDSPDRVNVDKGAKAAATIGQSEFPTAAFCLSRVIWIGLCSAHYFRESNNQAILVPWGAWALPGMLSFDWKINRFKETPNLPSNIVFTASNTLWEKEKKAKIGYEKKSQPYRNGFLGGVFNVESAQPINGMMIPSKFSLKRFRSGANEGRILEQTIIDVTNISTLAVNSFIPKITRTTDVSDTMDASEAMPRFGITYTLTNNNWLAKSDPKRLAMLEAHKSAYWSWRRALDAKAAASGQTSHPARRIVVVVVMILSIASAPIFFYLRFRNLKPK